MIKLLPQSGVCSDRMPMLILVVMRKSQLGLSLGWVLCCNASFAYGYSCCYQNAGELTAGPDEDWDYCIRKKQERFHPT